MGMKRNRKGAAGQGLQGFMHPIFVPIGDRDEASVRYYKDAGVPVARFALPRRGMHYYAILQGRTQAEADAVNRQFGSWERKESRDRARRARHEVSYEALAEDGFDAAAEDAGPEDAAVGLAVVRALYEEIAKLSAEGLRICRMVADGEPECAAAAEMGMKRTTMRDHKRAVFAGLAERLDGYR